MGGKLQKHGRLPSAAYWKLKERATQAADVAYGPGNWMIPREAPEKIDFGDLDVLVLSSSCTEGANDTFGTALQSKEQTTGKVWQGNNGFSTFEVPVSPEEQLAGGGGTPRAFQVDVFPRADRQMLQDCHDFMSWGEMGNILSRLVRPYGLMWGQDGLEYVLRDAENQHFKAQTRVGGIAEVLKLSGLQLERWRAGFSSEAEMFGWLMSAEAFDPLAFIGMSASSRRRIKDRPGMLRFMELVEQAHPELVGRERSQKVRHSRYQLAAALGEEAGGQLLRWLDQQEEIARRIRDRKAKLNGRVVMEHWPQLEGKAMGNYMKRLQEHLEQLHPNGWEAWVEAHSSAEVAEVISGFAPEPAAANADEHERNRKE